MCRTAQAVVRCVARSSGTRGSISEMAASFDAPFSLSWRVIQRQKQRTTSAAQCAPSTRAAGISATNNEQTNRKQGGARVTTRNDARERRISTKENGSYSHQGGFIARRTQGPLHERTSTTAGRSGSPRRLQAHVDFTKQAQRTGSPPLSGRGVWFSHTRAPLAIGLCLRSRLPGQASPFVLTEPSEFGAHDPFGTLDGGALS